MFSLANAAAVAYPELGAAVSFYGRQPNAEDVVKIKAPVMSHLAEQDERINASYITQNEARMSDTSA